MGRPVRAWVRDAVILRDGGICVLRIEGAGCTGVGEVADHRANRGSGGAVSLDGFSNLIAACSLCNGFKEALPDRTLLVDLIRRGVRVRADSTHAKTAVRARETAVTYPDGRVWFLCDLGHRHETSEQCE